MAKDRFSLLLTCNASGDCLMKPLVIYKSKKPRAYSGCDMTKLNVYWEQTKKGYMTTKLSVKWFDVCFVKDAKEYCRKKNLAFKVVLFLDNAPSHARFLVGRHPAVEVVFLPPITTSEIIANAKLLYYKYVHNKMRIETDKQEEMKEIAENVSSSEEEMEDPPLAASPAPLDSTAASPDSPSTSPAPHISPTASCSTSTYPPGIPATRTIMTVAAFWKKYNIRQAVNFFVKAWNNTTLATIKHAWSALLPQLKSTETERERTSGLMSQVLEDVRSIPAPGFEEVTREELEEMLRDDDADNIEDLVDDEEDGNSGDEASGAEEPDQRKVSTQKLSFLLSNCTTLQDVIQDVESDSGKRERMIGLVNQISREYQKQYNDRVNERQQSLITRFLSRRREAKEEQQRGIEDEDVDDIGDLPEDFDFVGFDEVMTKVDESGEKAARGESGEGSGGTQ